MTDPYVGRLETYLRALEKRLVEVDQRVARILLRGKVTEVKAVQNDWQVRLEIGRDPETDDAVKSPWVSVQPASSGDLKIKVKPTVGEGMSLLSPSGTVGSGSWAIRTPFDDDHQAPTGDQDVVIERGDTRVEIDDQHVKAKVADAFTEVTRDMVRGRIGESRYAAKKAFAKLRTDDAYVVTMKGKVIVSHEPVIDKDPEPAI